MKKLSIHSFFSFCCFMLFFSNLLTANDLSSTTLPPPTVTVPDVFDTDGDGNTTEPTLNADGAPLIQYCANIDIANIPIATAQGEPGAIFFWYYDIDPLDDPDFTVSPPTGVQQAIGVFGPGDQDFNSGYTFSQSDSIYVVQSINDDISDYTFVELIINESPFINILPASLCDDGMGNITPATVIPIVSGGDGNYTYSWITPASYTGPTNQAEITTSTPGIYTLTVTDGNMCTDTETAVVTFDTPPEVELIIASPTTCLGSVIEVITNVTDPDQDDNGTYFYNWSLTGSASISGAQTAVLTATANTTVTVIVTDSNGCQGSDEILVTLNSAPTFPSDLPEVLVCLPGNPTPDLTELDAAILTNVINGTVTWYDGNPETTGSLIVDPTNVNIPTIFNGIYAKITDNDTGCQNSIQITTIYDLIPIPDAGPDLSLLCMDSTPITVSGSLMPGQTAQWFGNNITDNDDGTAVFDPSGLTGSFTLTYIVTSQFGCVGSDTKKITISSTGATCDDNNAGTLNDVYNDNCECFGTPVAQNFCNDPVLNIIDNPIADGTYDATQIVISTGVVANGSTVSHIAGDLVILNPGFTVEPNVYFVADIIPCPMLITQPETNDTNEKQE